jgi:hypothetical protein
MKEIVSNTVYLMRVGLFVVVATVEGVSRMLARAGSKVRNRIYPTHRDTSNGPVELSHDSTHSENRA